MTKQEFLDALECEFDTMLKIAEAKNADYCGSDDPFANFRQIENIGVTTAEVGILVRMSDKMSRIANLLGNGKSPKVNDEKVTDTLRDLANYAIILKLLIEDENLKKKFHCAPLFIRNP